MVRDVIPPQFPKSHGYFFWHGNEEAANDEKVLVSHGPCSPLTIPSGMFERTRKQLVRAHVV